MVKRDIARCPYCGKGHWKTSVFNECQKKHMRKARKWTKDGKKVGGK